MADDNQRGRYAHIPIPSYGEATSSQPSPLLGAPESNDAAERQGLLDQRDDRYRPPTVESPRASEDSDLHLPEVNGEDDERRQIEELDYLDPSAPDTSRRSPRLYHRTRLRGKWSQPWAHLGASLSWIRLPSLRSLYTPVAPTDTATNDDDPEAQSRLGRILQRLRIPERYRVSAPNTARLVGLFTLMGLIYVLFALDVFPGAHRGDMGMHFDPEAVRAFVQENINGGNMQGFLNHITSYDHVAGTEGDLYLARWMQEFWQETGSFDELALLPYYVYLNYPGERSVSLKVPGVPSWTAKLEEEKVYQDREQTLAWHGHSKSGEAEGHLIYANGGSRDDFAFLQSQGIVTKGSIALVKYGGTQGDRALKIKAAEEAGCAGVLIYSDPSDVAANSEWHPSEDMLQRGGVSMMSYVIGDPLTPGYASTQKAPRISKDNNPGLPKIPSLPFSWRDAKALLLALDGHGVVVPQTWAHGPSDFKLKKWYSGNATSGTDQNVPIVTLKNNNEESEQQEIWNLHGMIEGLETSQKKVIIGAHRDAWCFGAVDPGSGTAVLMEIVRVFGDLRKHGWRPLRTIEFVSWDAEEYNLVGSTEYVEDNVDYLREHGVAYLNVDSGVYGPTFRASGSPLWRPALMHAINRVDDPSGNASLKQTWDEHGSKFEGLGAGSDYVAFQDIAGTSSIDFGFATPGDTEDGKHYPYHSCYETFDWMQNYGDPGMEFSRHRSLAQVWALLILEVADRPLLPFDLRVYAEQMHEYISVLERNMAAHYAKLEGHQSASADDLMIAKNFTVQPLKDAADLFTSNAESFHRFEDTWTSNVLASGGLESAQFAFRRMDYNDKLAHFEVDLLDLEGLPGRKQFKHVVFGPQIWSGYDVGYFPGVRDAAENGDWKVAMKMVERAAEKVKEASKKLVS